MPIDARNLINSPLGLNIVYLIGKLTPYWLGYKIAYFAADRISARKDWPMVKTVRCNQAVVHGGNPDKATLDQLVADNFRSTATAIFDFYHTKNNPAASLRLIEPHPVAIRFVQRPEFAERGVVVAGVHMSNFDMAFQMGGLAGIKALSLTLPQLNAAYQKQLEMRRKSGLNIVPTSFGSIKQALIHLMSGGLVITALDRPDEDSTYRPKFFGLPAALPIHHVFLALKANVPIVVAAIMKQDDGKYRFFFSDPIEMQHHPDRRQEILLNAEIVLRVAESYIKMSPSQWSMSFAVWPQALAQMPE